MNCPNCQLPFVEEKDEKFFCSTCGWLEKVGKEWKSCDAPVLESSPKPGPEPEPVQETSSEPDPAKRDPCPASLEPDPAELEPDPAALEPDPSCVKSYLGGLVTVTEVDE